jgi:hypothetical protein
LTEATLVDVPERHEPSRHGDDLQAGDMA